MLSRFEELDAIIRTLKSCNSMIIHELPVYQPCIQYKLKHSIQRNKQEIHYISIECPFDRNWVFAEVIYYNETHDIQETIEIKDMDDLEEWIFTLFNTNNNNNNNNN